MCKSHLSCCVAGRRRWGFLMRETSKYQQSGWAMQEERQKLISKTVFKNCQHLASASISQPGNGYITVLGKRELGADNIEVTFFVTFHSTFLTARPVFRHTSFKWAFLLGCSSLGHGGMNSPSRKYVDAKREDGLFWDQQSWKKKRASVFSSVDILGFGGRRDFNTAYELLGRYHLNQLALQQHWQAKWPLISPVNLSIMTECIAHEVWKSDNYSQSLIVTWVVYFKG